MNRYDGLAALPDSLKVLGCAGCGAILCSESCADAARRYGLLPPAGWVPYPPAPTLHRSPLCQSCWRELQGESEGEGSDDAA